MINDKDDKLKEDLDLSSSEEFDLQDNEDNIEK